MRFMKTMLYIRAYRQYAVFCRLSLHWKFKGRNFYGALSELRLLRILW